MARRRGRQNRGQFQQGSLALAGLGLLSGCGEPLWLPRPPPPAPRLGLLGPPRELVRPVDAAFQHGLRNRGWSEQRARRSRGRSDERTRSAV